jgi:excisionase family DNA binding protein
VKRITHPTKTETPETVPGITEAAPLVRAEVIAKALDVHKRTVCLWAQNGTIPCRRIGGIVRFNLSEVMEAASAGKGQ